MSILFNILCTLVLINLQVFASNYCQRRSYQVGNNTSSSLRCSKIPDPIIINMTPYQELIIQGINKYRNEVATCTVQGFPPACRMPTVQWSNDLARHAARNLKHCSNTLHGCNNMERDIPGGMTQIVEYWVFADINHISSFQNRCLSSLVHMWYGNIHHANEMKIASYQRSGPDYGKFAILVNQRVDRIGCAATAIQRKYLHIDFITICIFSARNVPGKVVYEEGEPSTGCTTGPNPNYPGLCSINERVNPHEN